MLGFVGGGGGDLDWCEDWGLGTGLVGCVGGGVVGVLFFAGVLWLWERCAGEGLAPVFGIIISRGLVLAVLRPLWVTVGAWGLLRRVLWCLLVIWRLSGLMWLLRLRGWRRSRLRKLRSLELRLLRGMPAKSQVGSSLLRCGCRSVIIWCRV